MGLVTEMLFFFVSTFVGSREVTAIFILFIVLMESLCHGLNQVQDILQKGITRGTDCQCM